MGLNGYSVKDDWLMRRLIESSVIVASTCRHQGDDPGLWRDGDSPVVEYGWLPRKHMTLYTPDFLDAFAMSAFVVARKVASSSRSHMLVCTAEELAFRAMVMVTMNALGKNPFFWPKGLMKQETKGRRRRLRNKLDRFETLAIEDRDVDLLFDMKLDGIEDKDHPAAIQTGIVNLSPRDWFSPFADRKVDRCVTVLATPWLEWLDSRVAGGTQS